VSWHGRCCCAVLMLLLCAAVLTRLLSLALAMEVRGVVVSYQV
jgi:hypothetical protein